MDNTSYIELSRKAYKSNIRFIKRIVGKGVKVSLVIKGNAYGHGVEQIIPMAEANNMFHFSVFSAFEAEKVQELKSPKSEILIFGYITDEQLEWVIDNNIEFYVFDQHRINLALIIAKKLRKKARIHLEVETGFNRTGIEPEEFLTFVRLLKKNTRHFILEGITTHFAGAESIANFVRIQDQIKEYRKHCLYFKRHGLVPLRRHTSSSAATLMYPKTIFDMVRVGIAQYGFWPTVETLIHRHNKYGDKESSLKRVISWKSQVMAIKEVKRGEYVGYGNNYLANNDMRVAVIPVGYNNGFSRQLSNRGRVLIHGNRVEVVGTVTMNTISVNVTYLKNVEPGDEVVIIGKQKKLSISVASFSEMSNYLNYQVLARLPVNIPRSIGD
jgi:alanine racemase